MVTFVAPAPEQGVSALEPRGAVAMATRRPRAAEPTILRDTWVVLLDASDVPRYTNCATGAEKTDRPPAHHIVMEPAEYMSERESFERTGETMGRFPKRQRMGLRDVCAGTR